ncbi:aminotransferase class V-fold PLP-dependent enzyme [Albirhodobacter sp. R86504]|uniref:aminotransferase class V-fold PLP-dependent enzyme n=1 Tax=Albirhodobacter sp. R86504 TaxID=3093848 RepID=UPI003672BBF3
MSASSGDAYLLYHSIGHYPEKDADLARELTAFSKNWSAFDDGQWGDVLPKRQRFIDLWAELIRAPKGTLTTAENVTAAMMSLIGSLPDNRLRGKKVLVAEDGFPSIHFLLSGLADRYGFALQTVPLRQGAHWVEEDDLIAEWDENVALALLTWISSTTSHKNDLPRLVAHGRAMGSLIGVDITQGAGLLPYDVSAPQVDFVISTSLKWLCGVPGAGILYVDEKLIPICEPDLRGWFSQDNPFSWALDKFAFAPDARRFDNGTPSTLSAIASLPALEWRMRQNDATFVAHNRRLCGQLCEGLDAMGLALATPRDADRRGGSLMVSLPDATPAADVVAKLRAQNIFMDCRSQTLRMSPGPITTEAGVARTLQALSELIA